MSTISQAIYDHLSARACVTEGQNHLWVHFHLAKTAEPPQIFQPYAPGIGIVSLASGYVTLWDPHDSITVDLLESEPDGSISLSDPQLLAFLDEWLERHAHKN